MLPTKNTEKPADGPAAAAEAPAAVAGPPGLRAYDMGPACGTARRLHLNEYRFPHPPGVVEALRRASEDAPVSALLTDYPRGPDPALLEDLARYVGAPSGRHILAAPGSDEVLRAVLDTSGLADVLMGVPSYTHFEQFARLRGYRLTAYPIGLASPARDHLASLLYYGGLLSSGCLVYLCSPNNPTGDLWSPGDVKALADRYPASLFLVDEAYVEFASCAAGGPAEGPDADHAAALNAASHARLACSRDNVVVARTMSKAFGFAALRVGYAVGSARTVLRLGVAVSPKGFNPLASPVVRAALRAPNLAHYHRMAVAAKAGADQVVRALRGLGWYALDTPGNFYLVYAGDAASVTARLAAAGVLARNRDDLPGLAGFIRLTAGSLEDNAAVFAAFAALPPPAAPPPQTLYTPKGVVAAIKTLVRSVLAVLARAQVTVWAQSGTMLGMARHRTALFRGGMIPTDDDADLAYLVRDGADPLAPLVGAFLEAGLTLQRNRTDRYWQVGTNPPGALISPVHVDVFSYRLVDGLYVLDDERFREEDPASPEAHCNTKYSPEELFPLSYRAWFYDLCIPMPCQAEKVLRRALGDDCFRVARVRTPGGLVEFELSDLTPA